jgi:alpha-mannosidase
MWDEGDCVRQAQQFLTPLRAAQFGKNASGTRSPRHSFLHLDSDTVVLSAVKKSERGEGLVVRLYNPTAKSAPATLRFDRPIREAWRLNLNEERQTAIRKIERKTLPLRLGAKKIETVEVVLEE